MNIPNTMGKISEKTIPKSFSTLLTSIKKAVIIKVV